MERPEVQLQRAREAKRAAGDPARAEATGRRSARRLLSQAPEAVARVGDASTDGGSELVSDRRIGGWLQKMELEAE